MNLESQAGDEESDLLFVNFNQDCTSLAVGKQSGYILYSLGSVDKLGPIYHNVSKDIYIVEQLFSNNLVAVVTLLVPRKLTLYNIKEGKPICNYNYFSSILAVKLNRERLIVCLEDRLLIHAMCTMDSLHTIHGIPPNPNGLCALSINNENCCLAYPGSNQNGTVQIFNAITLKTGVSIAAHKSPIAALAFNRQGSIIATASGKGTVIRVFSIPDGDTLFEFRRGLKRYVHINSLSFSADSFYLCASSNTETVHIFRMETQTYSKPQESWFEYYLNSAIKQSAAYLPSQVSDLFNKDRAFAVCRLPNNGFKNVCAIATIQKVLCVLVASQDGWFYIYNLNPNDTGECMLIKQHRIVHGVTVDEWDAILGCVQRLCYYRISETPGVPGKCWPKYGIWSWI